MPTWMVLLADDLSGALDSAVPFRMAGRRVAVAIDVGAVEAAMANRPEVLAINLACREAAVDLAANNVRSLAPMLASLAPRIVMMKIDSRMKGPVAALIDAALASSGRRSAIVCPAVPDMGRFVVGGRLVGIGVDRPTEVAAGVSANPAVMCRDADSAATMRTVAAEVLDDSETVLAVGARGIAQALADATAAQPRPSPPAAEIVRAPLILAIGSRDPITVEQVDRVTRATNDLGGAVVLIRAAGVTGDPAKVSAELAEQVARIVDTRAGATILASGGDTAMAIVRRLGIRALVPQGELAPGIPLSFDAGRPDVLIATKSGGFGDPDTLVTCLSPILRHQALSSCRAGIGA